MKRFMTLLMALVMVLGLATTVFAADSTITYNGKGKLFEFAPGSVYTETDLFENSKGVMPGDTKTEKITIENKCTSCDYIKVSIRGLLHDASGNPISPKVLEQLKADERNEDLTELEYMHEFLDQLTLTVKHGNDLIYKGKPSTLETGFESGEAVYLGSLNKGDKPLTLDVTLEVPLTMGNEFADRIGEVDWVLVVSEMEYEDAKTGDETMILPYVILLAAAAAGLAVMFVTKRRKQN